MTVTPEVLQEVPFMSKEIRSVGTEGVKIEDAIDLKLKRSFP